MKYQKFVLIAMLALLVTVVPSSLLAQGGGEDYVVQEGDTLSKIAEAAYGDLQAFQAIIEATNQKAAEDDSYTAITNPDALEIGQKLYLPAAETEGSQAAVEDTAAAAAAAAEISSDVAGVSLDSEVSGTVSTLVSSCLISTIAEAIFC